MILGTFFLLPRAFSGPLEVLSQSAYVVSGGELCHGVEAAKADTVLSQSEKECQLYRGPTEEFRKSFFPLIDQSMDSYEDRLFSLLAKQQARELDCAAEFAQFVGDGKADSSETILTYLTNLRIHKKALASKVMELSRNPLIANKNCPNSLEELKRNSPDFEEKIFNTNSHICEEIIRHRSAYQAILNMIPLSGVPLIKNWIEKYASLPENKEFEHLQVSLGLSLNKIYREAAGLLKAESTKLDQRARRDGHGNFDRGARSALLSDPALIKKVVNDSSDPATMDALACRANARYGQGAEALNTGMAVGSFALSLGAAAAIKFGSLGMRFNSIAQSARSGGLISLNAARGLQAGALAFDSVNVIAAVDQECLSEGKPAFSQLGSKEKFGQCVSAPAPGQLKTDKCILAATLAAMSFGLAALPSLSRLGTNLSHSANQSPSRVSQILGREVTQSESDAIERAHLIGVGEIGKDGGPAALGNYTWGQLRKKNVELKEHGFSDKEIRLLVEKNVVGFTPEEARSLFAQRYLDPNKSTNPRQKQFREDWGQNRMSQAIEEQRILSVPIDERRIAVRLLAQNPNGTLEVELSNGIHRTVSSKDLPEVSYASQQSVEKFNDIRPNRLGIEKAISEGQGTKEFRQLLDPLSAKDEGTAVFRRKWASGELAEAAPSGSEIINFTPDGGRGVIPGVVNRVFADGRVQVVTPRGQTLILTDSELSSASISPSLAKQKLPGYRSPPSRLADSASSGSKSNPISQLFRGQPGISVDSGQVYRSVRKYRTPDGKEFRFTLISNDKFRKGAADSGAVHEFSKATTAGNLNPGEYTVIITREGKLVTGKVKNQFELGVKHADLAYGKEAVVGGELKIFSDGRYQFNLESGSITRSLMSRNKVPKDDLKIKLESSLNHFLGRPGQYTDEILLSQKSPSLDDLRKVCKMKEFYLFNEVACCEAARIGCH